MRATLLVISMALAAAAAGPSYALEANDAMSAWQSASADDKAKLVASLTKESGQSARAEIVKCVDAAANVSGHADLPIAQIVKACGSADRAGERV